MTKWSYQYEVKGIQAWILATDRLQELRGGSLRVERLDREFGKLVEGGELGERATLVRAAGGVGRAEFNDRAAAESLARWWPLLAQEWLPGATVLQALCESGSNGSADLHTRLGAARNAAAPPSAPGGPLADRSPHTGLVATRRCKPPRSHREVPIDAATSAKLDAAKDPSAEAYAHALPEGVRLAASDDELGPGYRAVIHVDGSGIGECVKGLVGAAATKAFSEALAASMAEAVRDAVAGYWRHEIDSGQADTAPLPLRVVVLGGDDVTLVCRARGALKLVRRLVQAFEKATENRAKALNLRDRPSLTAGAGVAFVRAGWPFRDAHDLANDLCKRAKAPFRGGAGRIPSAVAFRRVTTSLAEADGHDAVHGHSLDGGPYLLGSGQEGYVTLEQLETLVTALGGLPRGPVREWLRAATEAPGGELEQAGWKRLRVVAGGKDLRGTKEVDRALEAIGCTGDSPWFNRAGDGKLRATAVADALALAALGGSDAE